MKHLFLIVASGIGLTACAPAPEPIYDASIYDGGKAGTLVQTSSPRPEPNPCWNKWGQHNNFPGCPWFAEGGGDMEHLKNGINPDNPLGDASIPGAGRVPDVDGGSPDDSGSGGDTDTPADPVGDTPEVDEPSEPNDPPSDTPTGGNPGNDKPVGNSNDKRPDHAKPDDGEKGNSDNKPSKKCGCKKPYYS